MFHFSQWVDLLLKAQGHRYLKRIPYMSGGKRRYRYIYKVTHTHQGKQAFDEAHLVEGTAFSLSSQQGNEFHGHIKSVTGDRVTYVIDDGPDKGKEVTESKRELLAKLNETHGITEQVGKEREKLKQQIELAKQKGSEKQVKLLEQRLSRLGGEQKRAEPEPQAESTDKQTPDQIIDTPARSMLDDTEMTELSLEQTKDLETLVGSIDLSLSEREKIKGSGARGKISYQSALGYAQGYSSRGVTAKEIRSFVSPMPARQDDVVYQLGAHGSLAIKKEGNKINYQYQFADGTVSNVMLLNTNKAKLNADDRRDIPQALAIAFFAGVSGGKEAYRRVTNLFDVQKELMIHKRTQRVANGFELLKQLDAVAQEGYRQRSTESPISPASVSGDATNLTEKQRKNLERYLDHDTIDIRGGATLDIAQDGRYIFAGNGRHIVYHVTDNNVPNAVLSGGRLFEGQGRPFARVMPNHAPSMTLDNMSIRKLRDALKNVPSGELIPSTLAKVGNVYDVKLANRVLARIPAHEGDGMNDGDQIRLPADMLYDALKTAGKSATLKIKDKTSPILVEAESGVNHLIMPMRSFK